MEVRAPASDGNSDGATFSPRPRLEGTPPLRPAPSPECPFPGLEPFSYALRDVFFARREETRRLVRNIVVHRGVLLFAASGVGKSSLINAGVIPGVQVEGYQPEKLRVQPRPGQEIVVERIAESSDCTSFLPSIFAEATDAQPRVVLSVDQFVRRVRECAAKAKPLLVFDQFEEWVTLFQEAAASAADRAQLDASQSAISRAITGLLNDSKLPVKILIALREDYLANLASLINDAPTLTDTYVRLLPLPSDQIRDVIRLPFETFSGVFKPELSEALAAEIRSQFLKRVEGGDIQLTEVQIVCRSLYEAGSDQQSVEETFAAHGVKGLLEAWLERTLESLSDEDRQVAVAILSRLVTSSGTRNVVSEDNLFAWLEKEDAIPARRARDVAHQLESSRARLIRCEPRRRVNYYEITSEFLVEWIRKKGDERAKELQLRKLREKVEREHRERWLRTRLIIASVIGVALSGLTLLAYINGRSAKQARWEATAQALAAQSFQASGERRALLAKQAYRIGSEKRTAEAMSPVGTAMFAALVATRTVPLEHYEQAIWSIASAAGQPLLAVSNSRGITLWNLRDRAPQGSSDPQMLLRGSFTAVALSPDGSRLAGGTSGGNIKTWNVRSDPIILEQSIQGNSRGLVYSVAFSPSGDRLAATFANGTVVVWERRRERFVAAQDFRLARGRAWSVGFSGTGDTLYTGSETSGVEGWSLRSGASSKRGAPPKRVASLPGVSVAVSRSGGLLATGGLDGTVRLWSTRSLTAPGRMLGSHSRAVVHVAFSADDSAIVTGAMDSTARVWMPHRSDALGAIAARHDGIVIGVGFSFDDNDVLSAGYDGRLLMSAARGPGQLPGVVAQFRGMVSGAAFSANLEQAVAVVVPNDSVAARPLGTSPTQRLRQMLGDAGDASIRSLRGDSVVISRHLAGSEVLAVALSDDGKLLATGGQDSIVHVMRLDSLGAPAVLLRGNGNDIRAVAFSPDGHLVASAGDDRIVRVWDWNSKNSQPMEFRGATDWIRTVAISADGKWIAAGGNDLTIRLWRIGGKPEPERSLGRHDGWVSALRFSSDGRALASGGDDELVYVWDLSAQHGSPLVFRAPGQTVTSVAFDRESRKLVAGSLDGSIRVWGLNEPNHAPIVISSGTGTVRAVAFSPDAEAVYSVATTGEVQRWTLGLDEASRALCDRAHRNMALNEWSDYMPRDMPYERTCIDQSVHPSLAAAVKRTIRNGHQDSARAIAALISRLERSNAPVNTEIIWYKAEVAIADGFLDSSAALIRQVRRSADSASQRRHSVPLRRAFLTQIAALSDRGQLDSAIAAYGQLTEIAPSDSALLGPARESLALLLIAKGDTAVRTGDVSGALLAFARADSLVGWRQIEPYDWNYLCWYGSLWGHAQNVMPACEHAVALAAESHEIRDSRGLARALTGNTKGAIEDFDYFVSRSASKEDRERRKRWMSALSKGGNPFTSAELQELRRQ